MVTSLILSIVRTISLLVWIWEGKKKTVGKPQFGAIPAAGTQHGMGWVGKDLEVIPVTTITSLLGGGAGLEHPHYDHKQEERKGRRIQGIP